MLSYGHACTSTRSMPTRPDWAARHTSRTGLPASPAELAREHRQTRRHEQQARAGLPLGGECLARRRAPRARGAVQVLQRDPCLKDARIHHKAGRQHLGRLLCDLCSGTGAVLSCRCASHQCRADRCMSRGLGRLCPGSQHLPQTSQSWSGGNCGYTTRGSTGQRNAEQCAAEQDYAV